MVPQLRVDHQLQGPVVPSAPNSSSVEVSLCCACRQYAVSATSPLCPLPSPLFSRTRAPGSSVGWEGEATVSDCSHENINKRVCNQHGCSWFPGFNGPWCHEPLTVPGGPMHGRGGMPDLMADPVDCGGFSELMCADRGCNWEPKPNAPWCTKPKKDEAPNNPHTVHTDHAAGTNIPRTEAAEA